MTPPGKVPGESSESDRQKAPRGPVLIELSGQPAASPAEAPPVADPGDGAQVTAMQTAATLAARRGSWLGRWFWRLFAALVGFLASLWVWNLVTELIASTPWLGYTALALFGALALVLAGLVVRELAALSRLRRLDRIQKQARDARLSDSLEPARKVIAQLRQLYDHRPELALALRDFTALEPDLLAGPDLLDAAEQKMMGPLDRAARAEIEAAARQVATITAIVPLALADVATALFANLRMIRRIAEIYGGRAGTLGSWRLTRTVLTHLVATGAVAVGDDIISSVVGGGVLSKVSRRFGEGVINGALTARVGVAALEVCRPLPHTALPRPSVRAIVQRALAGLFGRPG